MSREGPTKTESLRRQTDELMAAQRAMTTAEPPLIVSCPVCGWRVRNRDICPAHTDKVGRRCGMSGQPMTEEL